MTNEEAAKIAAAIHEQAHKDIANDAFAFSVVRDALEEIAEAVASLYATSQRVPESARQAFMIACGL